MLRAIFDGAWELMSFYLYFIETAPWWQIVPALAGVAVVLFVFDAWTKELERL